MKIMIPSVSGIVQTEDVCFGDVRFDGTRLPLGSVFGRLIGGDSEEDVMRDHDLTREQMKAFYLFARECVKRVVDAAPYSLGKELARKSRGR